jgi:hypothetical protein
MGDAFGKSDLPNRVSAPTRTGRTPTHPVTLGSDHLEKADPAVSNEDQTSCIGDLGISHTDCLLVEKNFHTVAVRRTPTRPYPAIWQPDSDSSVGFDH